MDTKNKIYSSNAFSYFAIKLVSIEGIFSNEQNKIYVQKLEENRNKHIKLINALIGEKDERLTYEIRYVCNAIKENQMLRKIDIYFICQLKNFTQDEVTKHLVTIYQILDATFDEYNFELLDSGQVKNLIMKKEPKFIYSYTRRVIIDRLDTLETGINVKNIGFSEHIPENINDNYEQSITYLFPYNYSIYKGEKFFADLSFHGINYFIIRVKIKPALVSREEENFIEQQIIKCEKFAQISLSSSITETEKIYPTLQKLARDYQNSLLNFLFGLKKNTALMTIEIESEEKLPEVYLHTLGPYFSSPVMASSNFDLQFTGNYEVVEIYNNDKNLKIEKEIKINLRKHPLIPENITRLLYLFNSEEICCAFRFPLQPTELIPNFNVSLFKERLAPVELIEQFQQQKKSGVLIGYNIYKSQKNEIRILDEDLKKHVYIIGQTGTGKSTLIETMVLDCIRTNKGVCFIDPHGDLFKRILGKIPKNRIRDVIVLDPADADYPIGFNVLEYYDPNQRYFIANEFVSIIRRLLISDYGEYAISHFTGPIFYKYLRNMLLLIMSDPDNPGTLIDLYNCFSSDNEWLKWYPLKFKDPILEIFIENELKNRSLTASSRDEVSLGEYVGSKLQNFVFDPLLRNIFIQRRSSINVLEIMNSGKILLVNLAKGELSEENSRFLGMILLTKIMSAAMERVKLPKSKRREFYIFVDEFQNIAINSFTILLSEARKFGLSLIIANQFIEQISDSKITLSIFGNVGTFICFRLGQIDASKIEQKFLPYVSSFNLTYLPNWYAFMTTLCKGKNTIPFVIQTKVDEEKYSKEIAKKVIDSSREQYSLNYTSIKK